MWLQLPETIWLICDPNFGESGGIGDGCGGNGNDVWSDPSFSYKSIVLKLFSRSSSSASRSGPSESDDVLDAEEAERVGDEDADPWGEDNDRLSPTVSVLEAGICVNWRVSGGLNIDLWSLMVWTHEESRIEAKKENFIFFINNQMRTVVIEIYTNPKSQDWFRCYTSH